MEIIKDGIMISKVILPEIPTPREKFAAEELSIYLQKICGAFSENYDGKTKIIIGGPERNAAAKELISEKEFDEEVPGPEGFMIFVKGDVLLLAGSSKNENEFERGTLYVVYEFLERVLGCSFAAYAGSAYNAGEFIAKSENIIIPEMKYVKKCADVEYRCAIVQYGAWAGNPNHPLNIPFISWLAKNRYNRILTWASIYEGFKENGMLEEAEKRGIAFTVGHHETIKLFLPPDGNKYFEESYYKTHPEFYRLEKDGSRYYMEPEDYNGQWILCLRSSECIKTFAENILKWSEENPMVDAVTIWPNDGVGDRCCCGKCSRYTKNQNYTYFVNKIAKILRENGSNLKIDRIVYTDLLECDKDDVIENSVVIDESVWQTNGLRKIGKPNGSGLIGSSYEKIILGWIEKGAKAVYYDYLMGNYGAKQRYMPQADEMQVLCKRFSEKGIYGLGTQLECFNLWNNIFNFYSFSRTAFDTSLSMEDNLNRFCLIFGNGAEYIKKIIEYCENVIDGQVSIDKAGEYLIRNADKAMVYDLFDKALETAEQTLFRNNIRIFRMVWRYSDLEVSSTDESNSTEIMSKVEDENGELWFMRQNFDSFISEREGIGAAFPIIKQHEGFKENKYYVFEK